MLGTVISPLIEECNSVMRQSVLTAARKTHPLTVGEQILYVEVKLLPYPRLVNCTVTVQAGEET